MCVCWGMQLYSGSRQNKGEGQVFWMCGQWDRQQREGLFCPACVAVVHIWSQGFKRAHASRHKNCGLLTAVVGGRGAVRAAILFAVGSGEVGLRRASAKTHLAAAGGHLGHALFSLQSLRPGQTQTERFHVLINQPFFFNLHHYRQSILGCLKCFPDWSVSHCDRILRAEAGLLLQLLLSHLTVRAFMFLHAQVWESGVRHIVKKPTQGGNLTREAKH